MPAYRRWSSALARGLRAALFAVAAGSAPAADAGSVVEHAEVRQANGGYVADLVIWLPAPRELAFAVLVDFERMPDWVPYLRQSGRGNQLVIVNVEIPTKLSKEQRDLFEKLATTLGTTVKPKDKGFLDWLNEALGG